ncbi:MAG TPA: hypothetical protein VFI72_16955 [Candidatus Angelobacter sp.]|nr:hypothetical protein [Candidatus Angelobacter sp.]
MKNKFLFSLILLLIFAAAVAQTPQSASQQPVPPAVASPQASPAPSASPAQRSPGPVASPSASPMPQASPSASPQVPHPQIETEEAQEQPEKEHKLTPAEAKDLLKSVDEVLHWVSEDTLLPVKHSVKKKIVSREQVEKFISDRFKNDVDRIRFERSELVLKKFGLLPREFDLHSFLIKLLTEQVAGYYDEKTKTMNLLDWVAPDMQKGVMAHELTHALQDQSFDLAKLAKREEEIEKRGLDDLRALLQNDEQSTCRSAILEGQGMVVLVDYELKPYGKSIENSPQIVDLIQGTMEKDKSSPVFESAPLLLKEELMFPYRQGMNFIKELLLSGGKKLAYEGVLENPPQTTREILQPKEYLAHRRITPMFLPDVSFLKKDYESYDAGAVGQLDVAILLKIFASDAQANYLSPEWRGGAYFAAGRKGAKPTDKNSTGHIGLFYQSKWATVGAAQEFARIYASSLSQRYNGLQPQPTQTPGLEQFNSTDGPIFIQQTGNLVMVSESFDPASAKQLIDTGLKQAQAAGPEQAKAAD